MQTIYESGAVRAARSAIARCVDRQGWLAVMGPVGVGKTTAVEDALQRIDGIETIWSLRLDVEGTRIGHVLERMIEDLSDETPRRSRVARESQWRRIVGNRVAAGGRIVLVVEEAQALHRETLRALKRLREMEFAGHRPLVTIIMIGQLELRERIRGVREVSLRVRRHSIEALTHSEVPAYIRTAGWSASDAAVNHLAGVCHIPQELDMILEDAQDAARLAGARQIRVEDLEQTRRQDLAARIRTSGMKQAEIARAAGVSAATVSQLASARYESAGAAAAMRVEETLEGFERGGKAKVG